MSDLSQVQRRYQLIEEIAEILRPHSLSPVQHVALQKALAQYSDDLVGEIIARAE